MTLEFANGNRVGKLHWKTALENTLEKGIGKQLWKFVLGNGVGKWH
jgi:hypothetical protein